MKLISVQSRGNRLVRIEDYEKFCWQRMVRRVLVTRKELIGKGHYRLTRRSYKKAETALKAAEKWLEGAQV